MDNKIEKILEDINKLQGYKVTYQYATAINIKDNNMNPWFEKIEEISIECKRSYTHFILLTIPR